MNEELNLTSLTVYEARSAPLDKGGSLEQRDGGPGPRRRVVVDVLPGSGTSVPGIPRPVPQGRHLCIVYEKDLPQILANVEDAWDEWERASAIYQRKLQADIATALRAVPERDTNRREATIRDVEARNENSPLREFYASMNRGLRKYREVVVLEDLPAEEDDRTRTVRDTAMATINAMNASANSAEVAALRAEIDELRKLVGKKK